MPGPGTTFGRRGATLAQGALQDAQCIVIQGSDMAASHPVAFRFVTKAKQRGATVIDVDPTFRRTSALVDLHVPLRPGSDIAFVGGLIRHVLEQKLYFEEYVVNYTNASSIVGEDFEDTEDLDGLFSGLDPEQGAYEFSTWQYEGQPVPAPTDNPGGLTTESFSEDVGRLGERPLPLRRGGGGLLAPALTQAGGALMRYAIVRAGQTSADDPHAYLDGTAPRR